MLQESCKDVATYRVGRVCHLSRSEVVPGCEEDFNVVDPIKNLLVPEVIGRRLTLKQQPSAWRTINPVLLLDKFLPT